MANSLTDRLGQLYGSIAKGDITPFDPSLIVLAAEHWDEPADQAYLLDWYGRLGVQFDARKSLVKAIEHAVEERASGDGEDAPPSPWAARRHISDFLSDMIEMPESLVSDIVYPSAVTIIAAPSATGKTICVLILAYELARGGIFRGDKLDSARVLLIDTDNPPAETQRRMKNICQDTNIQLEIITRDKAPLLTDEDAWKRLPADQFDVIILDSFGGATPGVSEREGAKTQTALRTLIDLADKKPAVIVLENTSKDALAYRGRGEKVERVEMFFQARDVTGWTPHAPEEWWEHIPDAGDTQWQKRASRRGKSDKMRVAFICRKARMGAEPPPFVLEVDFTANPWSIKDVTEDVELAGQEYSENERRALQQRLNTTASELAKLVQERYAAGDPIGKTEAENFLMKKDLKQLQVRNIITSFDASTYPDCGAWVVSIPKGKGGKKALLPLSCSVNTSGNDKNNDPANIHNRKDLQTGYFCRPHKTGPTEINTFPHIENKGVIAHSISVVAQTHSGNEPVSAATSIPLHIENKGVAARNISAVEQVHSDNKPVPTETPRPTQNRRLCGKCGGDAFTYGVTTITCKACGRIELEDI